MPAIEMYVEATPERVWQVLSLPKTYEHWVVGSRSVESWHAEFPAQGAKFAHTQGKAPLVIRDETEVVESDPPRRLVLIAKARPLLVARVILDLRAQGAGTCVRMDELPEGGFLAPLIRTRAGRTLTRGRNKESLRRVREQAEAPED